jgi:hypothetical protein
MKTFSTKKFRFSSDSGEFTAMASDLGLRVGEVPYERLHPDACDVGLQLESTRSGVTAIYYLDFRAGDCGDLWRFLPTPETIRRTPAAKGTQVVIFND